MRHSMSIRFKIIFSSVIILCAAVTIIGIFFWSTFYNYLEKNAYDNLNTSIVHAEKSLSSNFDQVENTLFTFFNTDTFRQWKENSLDLKPPEESTGNESEINSSYYIFDKTQKDISSILMFNNCWIEKFIHSSYVIVDETPVQLHVSRSFIPNDAEIFKKVYEQIKDTDFKTLYIPPSSASRFVYVAKRFYNITMTKQLVFISSLDPQYFGSELYNLPEGITASLVDQNGTVYFSNDAKMNGQKSQFNVADMTPNKSILNGYETTINREKQLVVLRTLDNTNFSIVFSIPKEYLSHQVMRSMTDYLVIILVVLVVFIALSVMLFSALTRFFKNITGSLNKICQKDYNVTMPSYKEQDLNAISIAFNSMTAEIKTLIQTVYQGKLLLKEADIKHLQTQMNPHFLINTLTTISTMALLHQDNLLYQMINALTKILDASLTNSTGGNPFISLSKELEFTNCYLYLQQIRFQDKLRYQIHVEDEALLKLYIPRLCIEPLVENAVVHGIEGNVESGSVDVLISREDNALLITIQDNGKGFDVEKVLSDNRHSSIEGHNISINNINKRLKLICGEDYGVTFESEPGVKTIARLRIPIVEQPYSTEELVRHDAYTDCRR